MKSKPQEPKAMLFHFTFLSTCISVGSVPSDARESHFFFFIPFPSLTLIQIITTNFEFHNFFEFVLLHLVWCAMKVLPSRSPARCLIFAATVSKKLKLIQCSRGAASALHFALQGAIIRYTNRDQQRARQAETHAESR